MMFSFLVAWSLLVNSALSHYHSASFVPSTDIQRCYTDEHNAELIANDPSIAASMQEVEDHYRDYMSLSDAERSMQQTSLPSVIEIPIVFHILYDTEELDIGYEQIIAQLNAINLDFSKTNPDWVNTPKEWYDLVTDYQYQYKLNRIIHQPTDLTAFVKMDSMKKSNEGGSDVVDPQHSLNIWACVLNGGLLGYAQFPGGPRATDGVVIHSYATGNRAQDYKGEWLMFNNYDLGRTLTHEIGHWIDLRHIWGDGNCDATDYVADTPSSSGYYFGCPEYPQNTCESNDMTMNFMDYVYDRCMIMFTNGQRQRSNPLLQADGFRSHLVDYYNQNPLSAPFVNAISFNVSPSAGPGGDLDSSPCAGDDVWVDQNINQGTDGNAIYACVQNTVNYYTDVITHIQVISGTDTCTDPNAVYIDTNLNYGVTSATATEVYLCYSKTSLANNDNDNGRGSVTGVSDVTFIMTTSPCDGNGQTNGDWTILSGSVNSGGENICVGVKYQDYETYSDSTSTESDSTDDGESSESNIKFSPHVVEKVGGSSSSMSESGNSGNNGAGSGSSTSSSWIVQDGAWVLIVGCVLTAVILIGSVVYGINNRAKKKAVDDYDDYSQFITDHERDDESNSRESGYGSVHEQVMA